MDQARDALGPRSLDHVEGARNVAALKLGSIVDYPGDVDHRFGSADQGAQRITRVKIAANPFNPFARVLRPPRQCAHRKFLIGRTVEQGLTYETGRTGQGNCHSTTIWSR